MIVSWERTVIANTTSGAAAHKNKPVLVASTVPELLALSAPVYLYRHCLFQQSLTTVCRTKMVFDTT
jgi:hypothetical protein